MQPMIFLLAALAVYRLSRMLSDEEGPFEVFTWLRTLGKPDSWIGRGLACIICLSVWVALPFALWIDASSDWWLTWLALSGVTVILRKWEFKK